MVDLPYARKQQSIVAGAPTPALQWNPAVPAATQAAVQGQFGAQYQGALAAEGADATGTLSGIGDGHRAATAGCMWGNGCGAGGRLGDPADRKHDSGPAPTSAPATTPRCGPRCNCWSADARRGGGRCRRWA
ncbi:hypothetical protein HUX88_24615 [Duganella sp. BJB1802]|uniref:hypothetical protein n=1 Tax=Duganella sp. BJB1802 TaxID=2744575 RepID=UPI0015935886|nr:hypothetical protein [Duganella sp. BJB1802]NVD73697.1 hypothetical protein [Duganella sp. BJB1802]